jgi:hypothetical protein
MTNVIALGRVASTGEPVAEVTRDLTQLIARAERGEIRGIAWGYVDGAGFATTGWQTGTADSATLCASIALLNHKMLTAWGDYDPAPPTDPPDDSA